MPRCGCASDQCDCHFIAGQNVIITGTGSQSNPYVVESVAGTAGGGGSGGGSGRLTGEIVAYAGPITPSGWLLCDGSEVNRGVYAALFSVIGTAYGGGDGMATFQLPDLTGAFPLGLNGDHPRGERGGSEETVLTTSQLPSHAHSINHDHGTTGNAGRHDHRVRVNTNSGSPSMGTLQRANPSGNFSNRNTLTNEGVHYHNVPPFQGDSGTTGNGAPISNLPPYAAVNYIIKT